jgi:hypothetical protein
MSAPHEDGAAPSGRAEEELQVLLAKVRTQEQQLIQLMAEVERLRIEIQKKMGQGH